jgi:hypothetical protein
MEIAGTQTEEDVGTNFDDVHGSKSEGHGYIVGSLANGDKIYVRIQGSSTLKNDNIETAEGTWSFTGGTGPDLESRRGIHFQPHLPALNPPCAKPTILPDILRKGGSYAALQILLSRLPEILP